MKRSLTGIPGLDEITSGGLPSGRVTLVTGGSGTGKTVLALQWLTAGTQRFLEPGLLVTCEERLDEVADNVSVFGWKVASATADPTASDRTEPAPVRVLEAELPIDAVLAGEFDLRGLLASLDACCARFDIRRVAFDGIDLILDVLNEPGLKRREILRIINWTRTRRVTTVLTAKEVWDSLPDQGYAFLRYGVGCVLALRNERHGSTTDRLIRVDKIRGSGHSLNSHPVLIRPDGLVVGNVGLARLTYEAATDRVPTGVEQLDHLIGGGFYRGSSTLVSGSPGTAKTTLAGAFLEAACLRGERALFVSFDEAFAQVRRNLASVGILLGPHVESGALIAAGFRAGRLNGEEHFHQLLEMMDSHRPAVMAIDPISALTKVAGEETAGELAERLIDEAKVRGITTLMTSLLQSPNGLQESTEVRISSIADTWIHLSFAIQNGERNRAITIIKSRGNAHSNQVRELLLSRDGLRLAEVYAQGGAVLMGTARFERERAVLAEEEQRLIEATLAQNQADELEAKLSARRLEVEAELAALKSRREVAEQQEIRRREVRDATHDQLLGRRQDKSTGPTTGS